MKKVISVLLIVVLCFFLCPFVGCGGTVKEGEKTRFLMDTEVTIRLYGYPRGEAGEAVFQKAFSLIAEIEAALSATVETSDVSRLNRARSVTDLCDHTRAVLTLCEQMQRETNGAFLATAGGVSALWKRAGEQNALPDPDELAAALAAARAGFTLTETGCSINAEGALLDLGGVGKGYAMDAVVSYLASLDIGGAIVSFGSNVSVLGGKGNGKPFAVALRDPEDPQGSVGVFKPFSGHLSVSGDYERYVTVGGVRYHHVIDPATGYPAASGLSSVAVVSDSAALSDALSTAFLVMGREKTETYLAERTDVGAVLIASDGTVTTAGQRCVSFTAG